MRAAPRWPPECAAAAGRHGCRGRACAEHALPGVALRRMIGWSSYLMSRMMVANWYNVHYYERYVNLEIRGRPLRGNCHSASLLLALNPLSNILSTVPSLNC